MRISRYERAANYAILFAFATFALWPVLSIVAAALGPDDSAADAARQGSGVLGVHIENLAHAWDQGRFGESMLTSVSVSVFVVTNSLRLANRDALERMITGRFAVWSSDEVLMRLDRAAIANGKMNDVDALFDHPQLVERRRYRRVKTERGDQDMFLPAVTISGVEPVMGPVPAVGQHTEAILAELAANRESASRSEA